MRVGLLHSPFLTPSASWGELPEALGRLGHDVVVVDADDAESPKDYARAAAEQLGSRQVVLMPHSGAGMLLPLIAARRDPGWVAAAVFIDATLPGVPGESRLATLRRRRPEEAEELARLLYAGGVWPPAGESSWPSAGVHPRGLTFFTEPVLVPSGGSDVPWAYLRTSEGYEPEALAAQASGRVVRRRELGHFAPTEAPESVASDLHELGLSLLA